MTNDAPPGAARRGTAPGRRALLAAATAAIAASPSPHLHAQEGGGTIRIVIPYPPGGGTDVLARPILPLLSESLRQPVIVDNRGGAGGNLGAAQVARAAPDGLTLLMANNAQAINQYLYRDPGYDLARGFEPVSLVGTSPLIVVVPARSPARSVADLVALARRRPGALNYGSSGPGTPGHMAAVLFNGLAGMDVVHVPYQGSGPTTIALLAAQVDYSVTTPAAVEPHIRSGALRALGVTSRERFASFPDVPALSETGIPALADFDLAIWWGLLAPAGTDARILDRLNAAVAAAVATPRLQEGWAAQGTIGRANSRDAFRALIGTELRRWERVVAENRITLD